MAFPERAFPGGTAPSWEERYSILKQSPMLGTEDDYVQGPVLLRGEGKLKPSTAATYPAAFDR